VHAPTSSIILSAALWALPHSDRPRVFFCTPLALILKLPRPSILPYRSLHIGYARGFEFPRSRCMAPGGYAVAGGCQCPWCVPSSPLPPHSPSPHPTSSPFLYLVASQNAHLSGCCVPWLRDSYFLAGTRRSPFTAMKHQESYDIFMYFWDAGCSRPLLLCECCRWAP
jgi:hypothetical protein